MPCLQVPKFYGLIQKICARPKIYLHIVAVTNILCQTKRWFAFSKIVFCAGTKVFEEALNAVKFLSWLKEFGLAQNILGPVNGQGRKLLLGENKIKVLIFLVHNKILRVRSRIKCRADTFFISFYFSKAYSMPIAYKKYMSFLWYSL